MFGTLRETHLAQGCCRSHFQPGLSINTCFGLLHIHTFAFAFVHSVQLYAALFRLCLRSSDPSAVRGGDDFPLMAFDPEDDACGKLEVKSASMTSSVIWRG